MRAIRKLHSIFAILIAAALGVEPAAAAQKVALLIGNARYDHATDLESPARDVAAMEGALRRLGYETRVVRDLDYRELGAALLDFGDQARGADTALVYYSGHGAEIGGENYLIPTDARLNRPRAERVEATPLSLALDATLGARRLSVVIVDACRNGAPGAEKSSVSKGFRPVSARPGMAIAFSTSPGEPAWDGAGALSPYTRALTEAIAEAPDLDVRRLFTSLGADTARYAGADQRPFSRFGDMPRRQVVSLVGERVEVAAQTSAAGDDLSDLGDDVAAARRRGDMRAVYNFGVRFRDGTSGKRQDHRAAVRLFRSACDGGHSRGCSGLAAMYRTGRGVAEDLVRAVSLDQKSCDGGDPYGCSNLGSSYRDGRGVAQDDVRAVALFRQGCDGGSARGCSSLGAMYETGRGGPKDFGEALSFYRKGCDQGDAYGCNNLGAVYEFGRSVEKNVAEATRLYRKALSIDPTLAAARNRLQALGESP